MFLLKSSIGKKAVMSATGLVLFGFVVVHMLGNLQIFLGAEALNRYGAMLQGLPELLWVARIVLLTCLILHMVLAVILTIENRKARPIGYQMKRTVTASFASKTMMLSGSVLLFFIIYHLLHFTIGTIHPDYFRLTDAQGRHDVYSMVVSGFRDLPTSLTYITAMALLALHLGHGVAVWPQSLGLSNERIKPCMDKFGRVAAVVIFLGNSSIPIAVMTGVLR